MRKAAIEALGKLGEAGAVEPLMAALKSPAVDVRKSAAEALGQIGDRRAAEPLKVAFEDRDSNLRRAATDALVALGWQPKVSKSGSPDRRASASIKEQ